MQSSLSPPIVPIQAPEIDGLAQVAEPDSGTAVQIGDGAGHLQNSVVGAGGETQAVHIVRGQEEKDALHTFGCLEMIVLWTETDYSACEKQ